MLRTNFFKILFAILVIWGIIYAFRPVEMSTPELTLNPEKQAKVRFEDKQKSDEKIEVSERDLGGISSDNYIKNAINSNGTFSIWKKMPVTVFIRPSQYDNVIQEALSAYNSVFNGFVRFALTNNSSNADIHISIVEKIENPNTSEIYVAGLTNNYYLSNDNSIKQSFMQLLSKAPKSESPMSKEGMYAVVMHELGHSLGILGHSQDRNDIMYAFTSNNRGQFTQRDISTIKILYSGDEELKKLSSRGYSELKLKEALDYVKVSSKNTIAWINLGNVYYDLKLSDKALDAYKRALMLDAKDSNIYQGMAQCYFMSKKYDRAIEYFNYAIALTDDAKAKNILTQMVGVSYAKKEDYPSAYNYLKRSYLVVPDNKDYLSNLLLACIYMGFKSEARGYIINYIARHPESKADATFVETLKWAK